MPTTIETIDGESLARRRPALEAYFLRRGEPLLAQHPRWLSVLQRGLRHRPYCVVADDGKNITGLLPLEFVGSMLFGRFLVGMPYLNTGGVLADDPAVADKLIDAAVELADRLDVRYLELRHERPIEHPKLAHRLSEKVHMRLELPSADETLWDAFKPKVRNQIRKGQKQDFAVHFGGRELLSDFYDVFARNMRDLGTPVFGRRLFARILAEFPEAAEFCVVRDGRRPIAAALLVHGPEMTEVPSASSLRRYNPANCNMLMYWHLLRRAIERGQRVFDFGRSSRDSNTFRFKRQWGAVEVPAIWQYYLRHGTIGDMRPDNARYGRMIRIWQKLPVPLTRLIGPPIVRGIP